MPIDGTYGRLGAHQQRIKEQRQKNQDRRCRRDAIKNLNKDNISDLKNSLNTKISPKELQLIKRHIQNKAIKERKKNTIITIILIILITVGVYYFYILILI